MTRFYEDVPPPVAMAKYKCDERAFPHDSRLIRIIFEFRPEPSLTQMLLCVSGLNVRESKEMATDWRHLSRDYVSSKYPRGLSSFHGPMWIGWADKKGLLGNS